MNPQPGSLKARAAALTLALGLALLPLPRARASSTPSPAARYQKSLQSLRGHYAALRKQRARLAALRKKHAARGKSGRAPARARSKAGFLLTKDEAQGLEAPPTGFLWVFELQAATLDKLKASPPPPTPTPAPTFPPPTPLLRPAPPQAAPASGPWHPPLIAPPSSPASGSGFLSRAGSALSGAWTRFGSPVASALGVPTAVPSSGSVASALGAPTGALTPGNLAATLSAVPTGVPAPGGVASALGAPTALSTPAPGALLALGASLYKAPPKTKAPTPTPAPTPRPALAAAPPPKPAPAPAGGPAAVSSAASAASATATAETPPVGLDSDQVTQLKDLLTPLLGREYPTQELFEAALDARLCDYARTLILNALRSEPDPPEAAQRAAILAQVQPPPWDRLKDKKLAAKYADLPADGAVAPGRLTWYLLPYAVRQWLLDQAAAERPLSYDAPIQWDNPEAGAYLGGVYPADGFYPLWMAQDRSQTPDFQVLSRVSLFAFTFDTRGELDTPKDWTGLDGFLAEAARHRTQVDFTLYRDDWDFLRTLGARDRRTLVQTAAQNALDLLDTPLPGAFARVKEHLPFFAEPQDYGSGITLWLVPPDPSDAELSRRFAVFYRALAEGLITALRSGSRDYALNLVICDPRYFHAPCFSVPTLYALFQDAENPPPVIQPSAYVSRTNLTLRFIVPLSDPVAASAERLRAQVVGSADLFGSVENLPLFMEKTVPLLFWDSGAFGQESESVDLDPARELKDNLVRLDSFYNTAFWPAPVLQGGAQSRELDQFLWSDLVLPGARPPTWAASQVAEYRWPLRCLFEVLLLALLAALAFLARRRLGDLQRPVQLGLLAVLVAVLAVGGLLLESDPRLASLRRHNLLLWLLIGVSALGALYAILKPRVEEP